MCATHIRTHCSSKREWRPNHLWRGWISWIAYIGLHIVTTISTCIYWTRTFQRLTSVQNLTHTHTHVRGVGGLFRLNYWNKIMVFDVSYVVVAFIKELIVLYTIDFRFDAHVHASLFSLCNSIRWTQLNITVEFFVFVPWFWHWWRVFVTIADHEQNTASISQSEFST